MESLFLKQKRLVSNTSTRIVRKVLNEINWDKRLISLRGSRGVGKTTILLQYIKLHYPLESRKVLYCSLDSIYFTSHTLLALAEEFVMMGGERLLLDEVHRYPNWSKEIKEIYDLYPELKVCITGSSLLKILNSDADLSRRCRPYDIHGLSFGEYLNFYHNVEMGSYSLDQILNEPTAICADINAKIPPVAYFKEYLKKGYYPFFDGNIEDYYINLENIVNLIVEQELPQICGLDVAYSRKIKALLLTLAVSVPFEVDISKLSKTMELSRNTVLTYLYYLNRAGLINLLYSDNLSIKKLQKPDKIFISDSNMLNALAQISGVKVGTIRETFAVNQLSVLHSLEYKKAEGDLLVDRKYTFEIGGKEKTFNQIAGLENSYIFADDMEFPIGHKLPLWLLGLLY